MLYNKNLEIFKEELLIFIGKTNNKELTIKGINFYTWNLRSKIYWNEKGSHKNFYLTLTMVKEWNKNKIETCETKNLRINIIKEMNILLVEHNIFQLEGIKLKWGLSYNQEKLLNNLIKNKYRIIYIKLIDKI